MGIKGRTYLREHEQKPLKILHFTAWTHGFLTDNEDFLTDKLSGEEKKRFLQYVDAWASVNGESTLDSFITGFRLGAQFTFDIFVTSKAPYADYLKDEI